MRRIRALSVGVAGVLLTLVGTGLAPAGAEQTSPDREPELHQGVNTAIRIGTHNIGQESGNPVGFAGVVGWQEVSSDEQDFEHNKLVRDRLKKRLPGYHHWFPKGAGSKAHPISWKKDRFEVVRNADKKRLMGSVKAHDGKAEQTPARWVNWVLLRDKQTNQRFVVVNTHMINGAWNGKRDGNKPLWRQHQRVLNGVVQDVRKFKAPVFVVGDFNKKQGPVKMEGVNRIPMQGKTTPYDHIYAQPRVASTDVRVLTNTVKAAKTFGSDHRALYTDVVIQRS